MLTIKDIEAHTAVGAMFRETPRTSRNLEGGIAAIGGLIKLVIMACGVWWLFFT